MCTYCSTYLDGPSPNKRHDSLFPTKKVENIDEKEG
jgi:hypothetical protein